MDDSLRLELFFSSRHLKSTWTPSLRFFFLSLGTHVAKYGRNFHIYARLVIDMFAHRCDSTCVAILCHGQFFSQFFSSFKNRNEGNLKLFFCLFHFFSSFLLLCDGLETINLFCEKGNDTLPFFVIFLSFLSFLIN